MNNIVRHPAVYRRPIQAVVDEIHQEHKANKYLEYAEAFFKDADDLRKQAEARYTAALRWLAKWAGETKL